LKGDIRAKKVAYMALLQKRPNVHCIPNILRRERP